MDTSGRLFAKLRSLAVFLETETVQLQNDCQNLNKDGDDREGAVQVLHQLHSEVKGLKRSVQNQLVSCEAESPGVRSFIKTCLVLKQRSTEDIDRLRKHYETYGYRPTRAARTHSANNPDVETDPRPGQQKDKVSEDEAEGEDEEQGTAGVAEGDLCVTPEKALSPPLDPMRTPQLSDFGLSELHLQRVLGGSDLCKDITPVAPVAPPSFAMDTLPPKPKTPKCVLSMDEDAPTPRLEDFGISEHTMCLNNDFTMDLHRKRPPKMAGEKGQKPPNALSMPGLPSVPPCHVSNESMDSPEPPQLWTPGFKIKKRQIPSTPGESAEPETPPRSNTRETTPELPQFETPYVGKLLSVRKNEEREQDSGVEGSRSQPSGPPPPNPNPDFCRTWSCDVPEMPVRLAQKDAETPERPSLQSLLGISLSRAGVSAGGPAAADVFGVTEPPQPVLHTQDGHTQEWSLASPRVRMEFPLEPSTPEMPDMSSVTQDIFKLVSQCNPRPFTASGQLSMKAGFQTVAKGKENRARSLVPVSEGEFHSLAGYLRQIPLASLNQAIHKINHTIQQRHDDGDTSCDEFQMVELQRILGVGPKAPMYILSLVELKKLENVQGIGSSAAYRIIT